MAFRDAQFPWLQEVTGRYEHPGESNNSSKPASITNDKPKRESHGSINNFMATVINQGLARQNSFFVEIGRTTAPLKIGLRCHQAQIPGINIATTDRDIGLRSIAYQQIYSDIILSFYCDANMHMYKFWEDWCKAAVSPINRRTGYYDEYANTIKIIQLDRKRKKVAHWLLEDAYPKTVDPISVDYSANDSVMSINVTITFRKFSTAFFDSNSGFEVEKNTLEFQELSQQLTINKLVDVVSDSGDGGNFFDMILKVVKKLGGNRVALQKEKSQVGGAGGSLHNQTPV